MADPSTDNGERTHEPTARRLAEARRRGQIPRSADLTSALAVLAGLLVLCLGGRGLLEGMASTTALLLDGRGSAGKAGAWVDPARDDVGEAVRSAASATVVRAAGLMAALAGLVAVAGLVQVGAVVATDRVKADWRRVSISAGWRRLRSSRTAVRALFAALKVAAVGGIAWWTARPMLGRIAAAPRLDSWSLASEAAGMTLRVAVYASLGLAVLGGAEYLYQRRQHRRDLRMTRHEWMKDMADAGTRPQVKRRRREAASALSKDTEGRGQ